MAKSKIMKMQSIDKINKGVGIANDAANLVVGGIAIKDSFNAYDAVREIDRGEPVGYEPVAMAPPKKSQTTEELEQQYLQEQIATQEMAQAALINKQAQDKRENDYKTKNDNTIVYIALAFGLFCIIAKKMKK